MTTHKGDNHIGLYNNGYFYREVSAKDLCYYLITDYDGVIKGNGSMEFVKFEDACQNSEQFINTYGVFENDITFSYCAGRTLTEFEKNLPLEQREKFSKMDIIKVNNIDEIVQFENKFNSKPNLNLSIYCIVPTSKIYYLDKSNMSPRLLKVLTEREPVFSHMNRKIVFIEEEMTFYLEHELK